MNRDQRRAAEARARNRARHDRFYQTYVRHLPQVEVDAPLERGRVCHLIFHHDPWCKFYDSERLSNCDCNPFVTRHVEPVRS